MHTKIKYLLLFFLMIHFVVSAQKNLIIYHVTGDVKIIDSNKISKAKRGNILLKNNSLQLKTGTDCMLIDSKGKSLQVSTAGSYTFDALQKMMLNSGNTGVTQKFFSYVYENLFSSDKDSKQSITPVVYRGEHAMLSPADNTIIISDAFTFKWKNASAKTPMHLTVYNTENGPVLDTIVKGIRTLQVDILKNNFAAGNVYKWKVEEVVTHQPEEKYFYFLLPEKIDRRQILKDNKMLFQTGVSKQLKAQMLQDIFMKWKSQYSK